MPVMPPSEPCKDAGYAFLKAYVINATGLAYYADKDDDLLQRLDRRREQSGQPDFHSYLQLLRHPMNGEAELDLLVEKLTVGETSFFRHSDLFAGLREEVLPELIERNRPYRRLRIWSAGCSVGAEAYSIGILLSQAFPDVFANWDISILGTDINRRFLAQARAGVFRSWDLRGTDQSVVDDCFGRTNDEWIIAPEYRNCVNFQYHNLVRHPFPSLSNNLVAFDLILCRNVLIYFDLEIIKRLIHQFHECLTDGGWLLVGHAEPNVGLFREFRTVNVPGAILYQKQDLHAPSRSSGSFEPERKPSSARNAESALRMDTVGHHCSGTQSATSARCNHEARLRSSAVPTGDSLAGIRQLADTGELIAAMKSCDRLIAEQSLDPMVHLHKAMIAEQMGLYDEVQAALRRTIYLESNNLLAHYFLGLLMQKHGRTSEALQAYGHVISLVSTQPDDQVIPGTGENMTVRELRELARMQEEVLKKS